MFKKNKKRQIKVEITFMHGSGIDSSPPKQMIDILPGQEFQTDYGTDKLWEGNTLIKEFYWKAGFTRVYEYLYV